jgi:exopolysaccharide biosynthesis polyprenyl glycosylphosphotransferase
VAGAVLLDAVSLWLGAVGLGAWEVACGHAWRGGPSLGHWLWRWLDTRGAIVLVPLWICASWAAGSYDAFLRAQPPDSRRSAVAVGHGTLLYCLAVIAVGRLPRSRLLAILALTGWAWIWFLGLSRYARSLLRHLVWSRGGRGRVAVVVNAEADLPPVRAALEAHALLAEPVAFYLCSPMPRIGSPTPGTLQLRHPDSSQALSACILCEHVRQVVLSGAICGSMEQEIIGLCSDLGVQCSREETVAASPAPGHLRDGAVRFRDLIPAPRHPWQAVTKEGMDLAGAATLLVCLSPLFVAIAALIRLLSPGPVLFRQERDGLDGSRFTMLKFRSMRVGAEALHASLVAQEPVDILFKPVADPRITPFGRFLRRSSLDELPQLWNVLRGDMSLVGPRPLTPVETARLPPAAGRRRLGMKPGMTGIWQVAGRSNIRSMDRRLALDLEYVRRWSLRLDLWILLRTVPAVLTARGAQ